MRNWCSVFFAVGALCAPAIAQTRDTMAGPQETAIVQKYCAGCHSDKLMYGGLSVQHFDGAAPDPTLAAMLLSKITNGHTPKDVLAADASEVSKMMKGSAMGASGQAPPDEATQVAFSRTLALQSKGAYDWNVQREAFGVQEGNVTASIVREKPSLKYEGVTDSYRLIVSCQVATRQGELKVTWANGAPKEGQPMSVSVDGGAPLEGKAEGGRAQGNGDGGPGAKVLSIPLPKQSLTVSNLFGEGTFTFPLSQLDNAVRRDLEACSPARGTAK